MKLTKAMLAVVLAPCIIAPQAAAAAVRPVTKPLQVMAKQQQTFGARNVRNGAAAKEANDLMGAPLLLILAAVAAVTVTVAVVASDNGSSPG